MLNASRSSLLSRSLPSYQEAALEFFEDASQELQTVLNDFKSCHHHQYRIKSEAEGEKEEEGFEEELKSSLATAHASDSEDDTENNQPLLDLASSDDQAAQTKEQEILSAYRVDSSYQAVDTFSQLETVQMNNQPANCDSLSSLTDDTTWSKLLLSSTVQPVTDEATAADLNLLKINPSAPLIPEVTSTITPHVTPVTSSGSTSVLHSLDDHTSPSPKLRDNWDELFADLDPLSNEKV